MSIVTEAYGAILLIRFNRPERKNALTLATEDECFDALLDAEANPNVRAIVVAGAGDAFGVGADLSPDSDAGRDVTFGSTERRDPRSPASRSVIKQQAHADWSSPLAEARTRTAEAVAQALRRRDVREGVRAFAENVPRRSRRRGKAASTESEGP